MSCQLFCTLVVVGTVLGVCTRLPVIVDCDVARYITAFYRITTQNAKLQNQKNIDATTIMKISINGNKLSLSLLLIFGYTYINSFIHFILILIMVVTPIFSHNGCHSSGLSVLRSSISEEFVQEMDSNL